MLEAFAISKKSIFVNRRGSGEEKLKEKEKIKGKKKNRKRRNCELGCTWLEKDGLGATKETKFD